MNERMKELGEELRRRVFEMMDAEPDIDGMEAGRIAARVEQSFLATVLPADEDDDAKEHAEMFDLLGQAKERAAQCEETMYVISIDNEPEDRERKVVDEAYLASAEFDAFDGEVEAWVHPDGEVGFGR